MPAPLGLVLGLGVSGFVACATFYAYQHYQREREREMLYWQPFQPVCAPESEDGNLRRDVLHEVEARLQELCHMQPGPSRTRQIRQLRGVYHPDRASGMPALQPLFEEVARLINTRTDALLDQDRLAAL